MNKYKRFTKEDDEIIANHIMMSDNMTIAFINAGIQLGRSGKSICQHYYSSKAFKDMRDKRAKAEKKRRKDVKATLTAEIKKNPGNIKEAIKCTADKTGMSVNAISTSYYCDKNSYLNKRNMDVCFTLISGKKVIHNGKNSDKNQPKVVQWKTNKLINFFTNLFKS